MKISKNKRDAIDALLRHPPLHLEGGGATVGYDFEQSFAMLTLAATGYTADGWYPCWITYYQIGAGWVESSEPAFVKRHEEDMANDDLVLGLLIKDIDGTSVSGTRRLPAYICVTYADDSPNEPVEEEICTEEIEIPVRDTGACVDEEWDYTWQTVTVVVPCPEEEE